MGSHSGNYYLRPEAGGCEWPARPDNVRKLESPRFLDVEHPSPPRSYEPIGDVA
ncbi:hypothetical protein ACWC5I_00100 [Kitasatospora sp. NPDC001574]